MGKGLRSVIPKMEAETGGWLEASLGYQVRNIFKKNHKTKRRGHEGRRDVLGEGRTR